MRKRKIGKKFSRKRDQRKALLKSLVSNLILKEKIKTTEAKAKEVSRFAEKLISHLLGGNVSDPSLVKGLGAKRLLTEFLSPVIVKKLEKEIAPRYQNRKGGYTRIIKMGPRKSDGTKIALIELVK